MTISCAKLCFSSLNLLPAAGNTLIGLPTGQPAKQVSFVSRESRLSQLTALNRISRAWGETQKRLLPERPPFEHAPIEFPVARVRKIPILISLDLGLSLSQSSGRSHIRLRTVVQKSCALTSLNKFSKYLQIVQFVCGLWGFFWSQQIKCLSLFYSLEQSSFKLFHLQLL